MVLAVLLYTVQVGVPDTQVQSGTIRESKIGSGDYSARSKLSQCDACAGTKKHTAKTQSKWVQKRCSVYSQRRFESSLSLSALVTVQQGRWLKENLYGPAYLP